MLEEQNPKWREGGKQQRKVWWLVLQVIGLMEEVEAARGMTWEQSASFFDAQLAGNGGKRGKKFGVASAGRSEHLGDIRKLLELPPKPSALP